MAIEQIAALDGWSLIALAVPVGARVLAIRSADAADLDARLTDRGCAVMHAFSVGAATEGFASNPPFDAVVIGDGFEQLADPVVALRAATALLTENGHLVVAAHNATNAAARIRAFLGTDVDPTALPPRRYDLAALEHVVDLAELVVVDRLRVFDDDAPGAPLPDALPAEIVALADGHAHTRSFVLVTARSSVATVATKQTLAEALQAQVDAAARKVLRAEADQTAITAERAAVNERLAEIEAELAAARAEIDDQRNELSVRADALLERIEMIDRLHTERRHLELDVAVKDDYIADLRTELGEWQIHYHTVRAEFDELLRSRHYRIAKMLHRVLRQIPFVHSAVRGSTKVLVPVAKKFRPVPETKD